MELLEQGHALNVTKRTRTKATLHFVIIADPEGRQQAPYLRVTEFAISIHLPLPRQINTTTIPFSTKHHPMIWNNSNRVMITQINSNKKGFLRRQIYTRATNQYEPDYQHPT